MGKLKKELKEFKMYKENYKFTQKELIEKNGCTYCEDLLLEDKERK